MEPAINHAYVFTFTQKYLQVQGYYGGRAEVGRGNERDRTSFVG